MVSVSIGLEAYSKQQVAHKKHWLCWQVVILRQISNERTIPPRPKGAPPLYESTGNAYVTFKEHDTLQVSKVATPQGAVLR